MGITPIVQGIGCSIISTEEKRLEDSLRAGGNTYLSAGLQAFQGSKTLDFANKALEAAELPTFSWVGKSVIHLTPFLLAVLKNKVNIPEKMRPVLAFFYNQLSNLYQIANVVCSLALLFFGQTFFAIPALLILGLGFMDRNGWLPYQFRQLLHRCSQPLTIVTGLVTGGILDRIFAALNALSWGANLYLARQRMLRNTFTVQKNLTPQMITDFFQGKFTITINKKFVHYNPFPPVPNIDIQLLIERFDEIDWNKHLPVLRRKFASDARFIERHKNPDLKTDKEIIDIAKNSLQTFITTVKERRILQGEPADYDKLHNYLKIITKHIEGQNDDVTRTDMILRLAIEGGEYCGPGKFEAAESVYAQTIGENPDIPFEDKALCCLQDERNIWAQKFYNEAVVANRAMAQAGALVDWHDVHNFNAFLNVYGDEFGLRKAGADNDDSAIVDPLLKLFISYQLNDWLQGRFWKDHTLRNHTDTLIESIGTPKLPKPEFYAFWQQWIERQKIGNSEKRRLTAELENARLCGKDLETGGRIRSDFVALMLLDMGIAEIAPKDVPNLNPLERFRAVQV
jgi:hypothetical protein